MVQLRKDPLISGQCYHVFNRSIAGFVICNDALEYDRLLELLDLHRFANFQYRFAMFSQLSEELQQEIRRTLLEKSDFLVEIIAYCLMPTHFHLILKQVAENGITRYISRVFNSFSKYFNAKHHRQGPLWSGHFRNVLVSDDRQLLHLSRYVHLNPTSAKLVDNPEIWRFSSLNEYLRSKSNSNIICNYRDSLETSPAKYRNFVYDQKDYQRRLSQIKSLLMDDYTG